MATGRSVNHPPPFSRILVFNKNLKNKIETIYSHSRSTKLSNSFFLRAYYCFRSQSRSSWRHTFVYCSVCVGVVSRKRIVWLCARLVARTHYDRGGANGPTDSLAKNNFKIRILTIFNTKFVPNWEFYLVYPRIPWMAPIHPREWRQGPPE